MDPLDAFAVALTAPDRQPPPGLAGPSTARFAVYRNNVAVGLIRGLEARFPAVLSLVGEEFFRAMARDFLSAHPPSSPLMMHLGDDLPAFLAGFPAARDLPYLADIARLEVAMSRAYHAPDLPRLGAAAFAALDPPDLAGLRVDLHPALATLRSVHPVWTIYAIATGRQAAAATVSWEPQAVRIDRPDFDTRVEPIAPSLALFLDALREGRTLAEATEQAASTTGDFDVGAALADLIGNGLAIQLHAGQEQD